MNKLIIQGIIIIFLWVGAWGIVEMGVDNIAGDNQRVRFGTYVALLLIGALLLWTAEVILQD